MAACVLYFRCFAIALSVFVATSTACQETGLLDSNLQPIHPYTPCTHILRTALGLARIRPAADNTDGSKLSQAKTALAPSFIDGRSLKDPENRMKLHSSTTIRSNDEQDSRFLRVSRGRLSRMPLQFGKRLTLKSNRVLSDQKLMGDPFWKSSGSRFGQQTLVKNTEKSLKRGRGLGQNSGGNSQMDDRYALWSQKTKPPAFEGTSRKEYKTELAGNRLMKRENEDGNDYISQRTVRGRLQRMPSGFGKRSGVKISPFFHRIDKQGSPAYEKAIKRLANKFGIRFLRGNRARLSRMPHLYGRKRRDDDDALLKTLGDDDMEGVSKGYDVDSPEDETVFNDEKDVDKIGENDTPSANGGIFTTENMAPEIMNKLNGERNTIWRQKSSLPHDKGYKHRTASTVRYGDLKNVKLTPLSNGLKEGLSHSETGNKRSILSRMPLTFGKRSRLGVLTSISTQNVHDSEISQDISSENRDRNTMSNNKNIVLSPERNSVSVSQNSRLAQTNFVPFEDDNTTTNDNDILKINDEHEQKLDSKFASAQNIPREDFSSDDKFTASRRSVLSRMPLSYGKRHVLRTNVGNKLDQGEFPVLEKFRDAVQIHHGEDSRISSTLDDMRDVKYESPRLVMK